LKQLYQALNDLWNVFNQVLEIQGQQNTKLAAIHEVLLEGQVGEEGNML